ncbi:MAG: right-handed parallel beta-helix repeat-containing protein [Proteobacteria bacterium]|nr:right-handed parallel beta-helix repeat-containing protein [Pseudomonadota bacterium]MBU1140778.1 right-handed parallel beta-helix repeat-containing protein [Pseudomonadota bacterium]
MKKLFILFSLVTIISLCSFAQAANRVVIIPLNSSSPVYVAGQEITSLPATISSSGFYFITKDLSSDSSLPGIAITADNVTLDLMGFSLVGPGASFVSSNGIHMDGRSNVEIRNGTVRSFPGSGIYEPSSAPTTAGHRILNMRVTGNGKHGIRMVGANHIVERCTAWDNTDAGISVGIGANVSNNSSYNNGDGIMTGGGARVTGNVCYDNTRYGIYTAFGSTVTNNTSYSNGGIGIYLVGNCYADQNCAYDNEGSVNMNTSCSNCTFGTNHAP